MTDTCTPQPVTRACCGAHKYIGEDKAVRFEPVLLFLLACGPTACSLDPDRSIVVLSEKVNSEPGDFSRIAEIERYIAPEATRESQLGSVSKVTVDPTNGDILVLDGDGTRAIYRFSAAGRFLKKYDIPRMEGNPQATHIVALNTGQIFIAAGRYVAAVSEIDTQGQRTRLPYVATDLVSDGKHLYAAAVARDSSQVINSVHVLDAQLKSVGSFHPYDERLDKYAYVPQTQLSIDGNHVYVTHSFDSILSIYDMDGNWVRSISVGPLSHNAELDAIWSKDRLSPTDKLKVRVGTRRYWMSYAYAASRLFLYERQREKRLHSVVLLNATTDNIQRYDGIRILAVDRAASARAVFDRIVGSYPGGLITVSGDVNRVNYLSSQMPKPLSAPFTDASNPLIFFVRFKDMSENRS